MRGRTRAEILADKVRTRVSGRSQARLAGHKPTGHDPRGARPNMRKPADA